MSKDKIKEKGITDGASFDGPIGTHRVAAPMNEAGRKTAEGWVERGYKMGKVVGSAWVWDRGPNRGGWLVYFKRETSDA